MSVKGEDIKQLEVKEIKKIKAAENEHLKKLRSIVEDAIREERSIVDQMASPDEEPVTTGQKIADKVASFGGSWKFIILFFVLLITWITVNALALGGIRFDPFPFILMNLVLSCIAALQAPVIMMSQNRKEEKDRKRAENDFMVNLKAEMEIRNLHQKIDLLLEEQIKMLFDTQAQQMNMIKELHQMIESLANSVNPGTSKKK
jgi:uncharacterized membrane protein